MKTFRDKRNLSGFTLVEILIVLSILGIMAMIALPRFANATDSARQASVSDQLRIFRSQIVLYRAQHNERNPGYPPNSTYASAQLLTDQLTKCSDALGNVSSQRSTVFMFGPYMNEFPRNPVNGFSTVTINSGTGPLTPTGTTGWIYQPATGTVIANLTGNDTEGKAYANY